MELMKAFSYEGNEVTFRTTNGTVYANATQMAKPFGKRTNDYLSNQSTKDFISAWMVSTPVAENPVTVIQGGIQQGTWMHEDIALHFSQWLNPFFAVWCNRRIKELLTTGTTTIHSKTEDQLLLEAMGILTARVEDQQKMLELKDRTIKEQAPKVQYVDEVLLSSSLISTTTIGKELGMSGSALNEKLNKMNIQYRQNGLWVLYSKYQNLGYTKTKTYTYTDSHGKEQTTISTYWTEKGRQFIHSLFRN